MIRIIIRRTIIILIVPGIWVLRDCVEVRCKGTGVGSRSNACKAVKPANLAVGAILVGAGLTGAGSGSGSRWPCGTVPERLVNVRLCSMRYSGAYTCIARACARRTWHAHARWLRGCGSTEALCVDVRA